MYNKVLVKSGDGKERWMYIWLILNEWLGIKLEKKNNLVFLFM